MSRFSAFKLEVARAGDGHVAWQELAEVRVLLQRLRSRPGLRRGAETVTASHHVRLRFRTDVEVGMRLRHDKRALIIHQVEAVGRRNGWLSCLCEEQRLMMRAEDK